MIKKFNKFIPLLLLIFILNPVNIEAKSLKNILFISSYSPSFISFNDQLQGLSNGFGPDYEVNVEYMDVKNFRGNEIEQNFYNLLKFKMKSYEKFDAIILGDDASLEFGLKYKDDLFENIPIVFFGVTEEYNIETAKKMNISGGVIEYASIKDTINLIGNIYKSNKNLILLAGNEKKYTREINDFYSCKEKFKNFNFKYIPIPPEVTKDFKDALSKIDKKNDIVLFIYPYRDGVGKSISVMEAIDTISDNIIAPTYTILNYDVYDGMIGGKVINHFNQGEKAALLVKDILNNKTLSNTFISSNKANTWMFNYNNLKSNNVPLNKLPKDSYIINKPVPFLVKYKKFIVPVFFTIIALLLIILVLISHIIKTKKHKQELHKAKKIAEDANIAKSNFIANISHELRTPVAVISSANQLSKLLLDKENINDSERIKNNFDIITQNSNRLLRLINNIIDVAKIDSGFYDLKLTTIDVINLIEDTVLSVIPYADTKNLNIIFDTNIEELLMSVDAEKIERIVLNLLSNAIKFSKPNGDIFTTITVNNESLSFIVQDNGIGIDNENLTKIFDKFMQIDNGFTRQNEGSGIGLSIVQSFVKLHQGSIKVYSEINKGTSFIIKLPIKCNLSDKIYNDIPSSDNITDIELSDIFK